MKKLLAITLISALIITLVPPAVYATLIKKFPDAVGKSNTYNDGTISVFIADEETAVNMSFNEYITGVVAAEMPVEFHEEALSAIACAAATLARLKLREGSEEDLKGAVISTDPKKHQAYMSKKEMQEKWGTGFDRYYQKLTEAVNKAIDYSITYNGELITPVYHAMSTGLTEDAENVWNGFVPYLTSVESPGDPLAPKYETTVTLSFDEFKEKIEENGADLGDDITLWLGESEYTKAGTLKNISIGGKSFTGTQLRSIFSLRSAAVVFSMTKDGVTMTVHGYGHGVGLSQYGADFFAEEGFSWTEILKHYYPGVEVEII